MTMRRVLPIALCLLGPALAGCVGVPTSPGAAVDEPPVDPPDLSEIEEKLTEPIYDAIQRTEHTVEGHGDAEIWLDVYRPEEANGTVPVILVMTPYQSIGDAFAPTEWTSDEGDCEPGRPEECPYSPWLVDYFAPRGYAVAFADVRGNHNSGGCIDQSGPDQWKDGYRVVEWLGTREWSSGEVGMYGASYDGETQITTALTNPPHLTTIVPTASVSNQYEYIHYDGVPYELQGVGTMAGYLAISAVPGTDPTGLQNYPERFMCQPENMQAAADLSGDWSPYWDDRDYRPGAPKIDASVLQVHGLQDWNVKPNHVDPIFNSYTSTKRLVVGQWDHAYPDSYCGTDATLCREDWTRIVHRWFDHWLMGIDTGILEDLPPVMIQSDAGDWRAVDAFPPRDPAIRSFHPAADGALAEAPADPAEVVVHDHPREMTSGTAREAVVTAGSTATGHPAELVFETDPLEEALHYTGRPTLELTFSSDAASTHWVVHLVEVDGEGRATWTNRGYLDTRHRHGVEDPEPMTPGETYNVTVRLFPQDDVIEAGHRLRLVLTNDDGWVHQDDTFATSTVLLGDGRTRLDVPLAPAGDPLPDDALRPGLAE